MTPPLISIVVIGRNEGARLTRCLDSLAAIAPGPFTTEILYVDSGSIDDSVARAEQHGCRVLRLQAARPTAALGRNAGWSAARGSIVLFLDGDTLLAKDFLKDSLAAFADPTVAILWGHRREIAVAASFYNRVLDLDWIYPPGDSSFCGGDALFRRSVLETTGGFDETLIAGEEPELCRRILALDLRIVHADRPMTGHDLAIHHFSQYWKRATRAGHAFAEVSARYAQSDNPFWLQESRANVRRATILLGLPFAGILFSLLLRSLVPVTIVLALLAALSLRTAWKARWKSGELLTLALYGVHSHLQQIPILVGQMHFWNNRAKGRHAALVEYKQP